MSREETGLLKGPELEDLHEIARRHGFIPHEFFGHTLKRWGRGDQAEPLYADLWIIRAPPTKQSPQIPKHYTMPFEPGAFERDLKAGVFGKPGDFGG